MITQAEAIIEAFNSLGGVRDAGQIKDWVYNKYGDRWKDFNTSLADMVPVSHGGNHSSTVPEYYRVLERKGRGLYSLIHK